MCLLGTVNKLTQDAVKSCDVASPLRAPDTSLVDRTGGGRALDSLQNIIILFISAGIHITHLDSLYLIVKPTNWPLFVTVFKFFQKLIKILLRRYIMVFITLKCISLQSQHTLILHY